MTRLEAVLERLRALPADEQDKMAVEIEGLLADPTSALLPSQWLEVEHELDSDDGVRLSHIDVMTRMRAKFGR